jgi:hypothetical protein
MKIRSIKSESFVDFLSKHSIACANISLWSGIIICVITKKLVLK